MSNGDSETVQCDTSESIETTSDAIDLRSSDLGDNGDTIGAELQIEEKPKKFLLPFNAPTYGLELPTCTKNAMIIFNQENFAKAHRKRNGSGEDAKNLKETFEQFKFEVVTYKDCNKEALLETLKGFWKRKYDAYGGVCVALMTHGRAGHLEASDKEFPESEFFNCFDIRENPSLAGKPIIIIVQACRGKNFTGSVKVELAMRGDEDNKPRFMYLPTHSNILVFRSCYLNTGSVRYPTGTLFIRSLCDQINKTPAEDFEYICVQVKRKVAEKFNLFFENQMPVVTSTLIRKLYLKDPGPDAELQGYGQDPRRMPPTYFLQYFNYIKKCVRLYSQRKDVPSATQHEYMNYVVDLVEKTENATSDMQLTFIQTASTYLKEEGERCRYSKDKNDEFPEFNFIYFHYDE